MKHLLASILILLVHTMVMAQPGGGGEPGGGEPVPLPGIWILVAAGAYLGIKKMFSKKHIQEQ
jgi:hypothetical protein